MGRIIQRRFEDKFTLNYRLFEKSFRWPIEFAFLEENEIEELFFLDEEDEESEIEDFRGVKLTRAQVKEIIIRKGREAEMSLKIDFLPFLKSELKLQNENIIHGFKGDKESWGELISSIREKEIVLLSTPLIELKIEGVDLPIRLKPTCISYYRGKFTLFLLSSNIKPGKKYFPRFLFYDFLFEQYLGVYFSEWALINKTLEGGRLSFSFSLASIKNPRDVSQPSGQIPIFIALDKEEPKYEWSIFSRALSEGEYLEKYRYSPEGRKKSNAQVIKSIGLLRSQIITRCRRLSELAFKLHDQLPETLEENSIWLREINWEGIIQLNSLRKHYFECCETELFSVEGKYFKKGVCLLYPKYKVFQLIDLRKGKLFEVINHLIDLIEEETEVPSFSNFLGSAFYSYNSRFKLSTATSVFSIEGEKALFKKITSVEWKVYYDFETYEDTLTQLSFQVFKGAQLLSMENLVFNPWEEDEEFEEKCISSLAQPILEIMGGREIAQEDLSFLRSKIVYIAFNKSFECSWMRRLASRHSDKKKLALHSKLVEELTQDLADWFKFSKNQSLNLIGELFKAHSLKKVVEVIWKDSKVTKKYSNLDWAQNGREASLLFLYFYTEIFGAKNLSELASKNKEISFTAISDEEQERQKREWEQVKGSLESYCELDVQTMIDGVEWLQKQYQKNKDKLVERERILSFISWFSAINSAELAELIREFVKLSKN